MHLSQQQLFGAAEEDLFKIFFLGFLFSVRETNQPATALLQLKYLNNQWFTTKSGPDDGKINHVDSAAALCVSNLTSATVELMQSQLPIREISNDKMMIKNQ